jgi:integrase
MPGCGNVTRAPKHRLAQLQERLRAGSRWVESDYVFTSTIGSPLEGTNVTRQFQRMMMAAGLPRLRFHDLRHSCATLLLAAGVDMRTVMEVLGHSQIGLTMNTYAHVLPNLMQGAADAMDRMLGGQS